MADEPMTVYVLWEQTPDWDAVLLGVFASFADAAAGSDRVLEANGMKLDDDKSTILDNVDMRYCVDVTTGDFITWHNIEARTIGVVDDSVRWFDNA